MFQIALIGLVVAALLHYLLTSPRGRHRFGDLLTRWVLVGYCGFPMLVVGYLAVARGPATAAYFGFAEAGPMVTFLGLAFLGLSLAAIHGGLVGGRYLFGPAVAWGVYWLGATFVHLHAEGDAGMSHGELWAVLVSHGLVGAILLLGLGLSGEAHPRRAFKLFHKAEAEG